MSTQIQSERYTDKTVEVEHGDPETGAQARAQLTALGEEIDDLLDDIDEALEENAEQFVRDFRQVSGQ